MPPPDPWTPDELGAHLSKLCGISFRVGPVEPDPKHASGTKFWVLLPLDGGVGATMAIVRVSAALDISVDVAAAKDEDDRTRKVVTIWRERLQNIGLCLKSHD